MEHKGDASTVSIVCGTTGARLMIMWGAVVALHEEIIQKTEYEVEEYIGSSGGSIASYLMTRELNMTPHEFIKKHIHYTKHCEVGGKSTFWNIYNALVHGAPLHSRSVIEDALNPMLQELKPNGEKASAVTWVVTSNQEAVLDLGSDFAVEHVAASCALQGAISPVHLTTESLRAGGVDPSKLGMTDGDVAVAVDGGTWQALAIKEIYRRPGMIQRFNKNGRFPPVVALTLDNISGEYSSESVGSWPKINPLARTLSTVFSLVGANVHNALEWNHDNNMPTYIIAIDTEGSFTTKDGRTVSLPSGGLTSFKISVEDALTQFDYGYEYVKDALGKPLSEVNGLQGVLCVGCGDDADSFDPTLIEAIDHYYQHSD